MADSNMAAIRQLSEELKKAASILDDPGKFDIGSVTSYMSKQFVPGRGLLDLGAEDTVAAARASDDQDGNSDEGGSDDDYKQKEDDDSSDSDFFDEEDAYDDAVILEWLNSERTDASIAAKYKPGLTKKVPGLRPEIEPYDHQAAGASIMEAAIKSKSKGIVNADPPGLGKTIQSLMPVASTREMGDGPSLVVCPTSCVPQWDQETSKFFYEKNMKTIAITAETGWVSPAELFKYHLVITSYSQVVSELVRIRKYVQNVKDYVPGATLPKRPAVTFLWGFLDPDAKPRGKVLILDEAHTFKNPKSRTFAAILWLREFYESCIMLTGTPLDNTWKDAFPLLKLIREHPIFEPRTMIHAFVRPGTKRKHNSWPMSTHLIRYKKALDSFMLRRPQDTIQALLPPITTDVVQFVMDEIDIRNSNEQFSKYLKLQHMSKAKMSKQERKDQKLAGFGALMSATHWTNHPELKDIVQFERDPDQKTPNADEPDPSIMDLSEQVQEDLRAWRAEIAKNWNWRSPRVDCIVDTVNRHRDLYPDDVLVIMDESVFFLDIIEIALTKMFDPVRCFRYDGRDHPARRAVILDKWRATPGLSALLASRGTGGVGLNLQHANVLIICGPLWKDSWYQQAEGRIYRAGQRKPVFVYRVEAMGFGRGALKFCQVEEFKKERRDSKKKINSRVLRGITRKDDEQPPKRDCY